MASINKLRKVKITGATGLEKAEAKYRKHKNAEIIPWAKNTSFKEIAERVIPDKKGAWKSPIYLYCSEHHSTIGVESLCKKTKEYLDKQKRSCPMDILSISAGMDGDKLSIVMLIRLYSDQEPSFKTLPLYLGEEFGKKQDVQKAKLIVPEKCKRHFSSKQIEQHARAVQAQKELLNNSSYDKPFLNSISKYVPESLDEIDPRTELIYDLKTKDMEISTMLKYEDFIKVFQECMRYITTVEKDTYYGVLRNPREKALKQNFWDIIEAYIFRNFVETKKLPREDKPALLKKLDRALFQLYIVQDLIDDEEITDVKITDPHSIRVRVNGKAYLSNVTFIDAADYGRFINSIIIKNNINAKIPSQTFTDEHDANYILRFSLTAAYVSGTGHPIIHIRKVSRKKLMAPDLIEKGMMDEKLRDYLIDCGKNSRGVVFAGPPGSGKTVALNWFLEDAYESSAEILVIQENDELFAYRNGVMFEHVVNNPLPGQRACSLESLGQIALVAGANVFVIGEAKGAEICSAITLSNSGCRTAITLHSTSSTETVDKMADLAMRGYANSYDQAKRMIKSFQTIVYLQDFKIQEISEIIGYDEERKDMIYRCIYRREKEPVSVDKDALVEEIEFL